MIVVPLKRQSNQQHSSSCKAVVTVQFERYLVTPCQWSCFLGTVDVNQDLLRVCQTANHILSVSSYVAQKHVGIVSASIMSFNKTEFLLLKKYKSVWWSFLVPTKIYAYGLYIFFWNLISSYCWSLRILYDLCTYMMLQYVL